jgi:hypothetical protein
VNGAAAAAEAAAEAAEEEEEEEAPGAEEEAPGAEEEAPGAEEEAAGAGVCLFLEACAVALALALFIPSRSSATSCTRDAPWLVG